MGKHRGTTGDRRKAEKNIQGGQGRPEVKREREMEQRRGGPESHPGVLGLA